MPSERYDPFASRLGADGLDLADSEELPRRAERQPVGAGARTGTTYGTTVGGGRPAVVPDETAMVAPLRDEPDSAIPQQGDDGRYDDYRDRGGYDAGRAASGPAYEDDDDDDEDYDDEDPADEPPIQHSSAADLARVATLDAAVLVIDGRPRYHVPSCPHLLGRENEPLPVHEAVELGFTPCSACTPNDVLLGARR
ncbi:hypothetical protein AB0M46_21260 [Dactylosporangium sp. NPDC051485]|uniref:hypothetical protein n=1 Tax=Dactylosporangium sp. NPDC051485 TaxID=3154846 RepID=UPI0034144525